ncbi:MAG: hypothetical protein K1X38_01760, partial [Microthrixaceae bacterium]|nr:hypothetical protein [Microthrixaceae bacterium]
MGSLLDVAGGADALTTVATQSPAEVVKLPVKHADGPFGSVRPRRTGSAALRRRLVGFDVASSLAGWGLAMVLPGLGAINTNEATTLTLAAIAVSAQLVMIAAQRLYQARVASRRAAELSGLWRATLFAGALEIG